MNEKNKDSAEKFAYRSPALVCYGKVTELTQSGTQSTAENCNSLQSQKSKPCSTSDPRAKENIVRIGTHPLGIGLYLFDYKPEFQAEWGHGRQFGVMADEVESVMPEAVCMHANGYKMVDYAMLGVTHSVH